MRTYRNGSIRVLLTGIMSMVMIKLMTISPLNAQIPQLINYQGKLTDLAGEPMPDGAYDMRFSLYDDATAGTLIWGPEEWSTITQQVQVADGLFTVLIGTHQSLDTVPFDTQYWMELEVYNDTTTTWETFSPRWQLASTPYALRAAEVADGVIDTTALADESITDEKIAPTGISAMKITSDTIDNSRINWASPGEIGTTIPANGHFSSLLVDGNVGIGTTVPSEVLDVLGNIAVSGTVDGRDLSTDGIKLDGISASASDTTDDSWEGTEVVYTTSGNVGIGTTAPTNKLHIMENITGGAGAQTVLILDSQRDGDQRVGDGPQLLFKIAGSTSSVGAAIAAVKANVYDANTATNLIFRTSDDDDILDTRMIIKSAGNVGIGTTTPSYTFHVEGTAYATGAAGALSDYRHKTNIRDLSLDAIEIVKELRPVVFEWKEPKDRGMEGEQFGFIAQEVEELLPEVVLTQDDEANTKGLKYNELIPILTKALQDIAAKNAVLYKTGTSLQATNTELKAAIDALQTRIEQQQEEIDFLKK